MTKNSGYSWNRNVSHHRIAMTRFAVYAYIMSLVAAWGTALIIGWQSDSSREYVVMSVAAAGFVHVGSFLAIFVIMTVMYRWVCDVDAMYTGKAKETKPDKFYQTETGWIKGK